MASNRLTPMFDYAARRRKLDEVLEQEGVDAMFVGLSSDLEYLSGLERNIPAFGNMSDQNSLAPDTVVTGPVWNMRPTVEYVIKQVKAGAYTAQDLKDFSMMGKGGASLAPLHSWEQKLPKDVSDLVTQKTETIKSGKFRVDINEADPTKK